MKAINQTITDKDSFTKALQQNIAKAVRLSDVSSVESIEDKLTELQQELLKMANNRQDYDEITDEIFRLRELKQQAEVDTVTRNEQIGRITDLQNFINEQPTDIQEFDEKLVRRLIGKITVFEDRFKVEFKSGVSVEIEG